MDRAAVSSALAASREDIRRTFTSPVVGDLGHFGGLFRLSGYREPVLVSSIDGVGTKVLLAASAGRLEVVGRDVVAHGINDVAVLGAEPLFVLDYLAAAQLDAGTVTAIMRGMTAACEQENVVLIGGETAQMPGVYTDRGLDVVGCMVGVVERDAVCDGSAIRPGDALIGMASTGLHTNGYTLARAVLAQRRWSLDAVPPGLGTSLADALLAPHRSYRRPLRALHRAQWLRGAAHITGGGIPENVTRVLPDRCRARVDTRTWPVPPIFEVLAQGGRVARDEMFHTFNMGIGMVAVVPVDRAGLAVDICKANGTEARVIGEIVAGEKGVELL